MRCSGNFADIGISVCGVTYNGELYHGLLWQFKNSGYYDVWLAWDGINQYGQQKVIYLGPSGYTYTPTAFYSGYVAQGNWTGFLAVCDGYSPDLPAPPNFTMHHEYHLVDNQANNVLDGTIEGWYMDNWWAYPANEDCYP